MTKPRTYNAELMLNRARHEGGRSFSPNALNAFITAIGNVVTEMLLTDWEVTGHPPGRLAIALTATVESDTDPTAN